ncbi:hypothetical protein FM996_20385 [Methylosinus sporium]|uniref:Uncharacterized protein n=1 Tax=Methylosinus sporium TaxID=428 RepID=A0A549SD22_METSR|nr:MULTISPECIES: hypothetical protein [Methylosinus]TRL24663.1 hypothetical protein FM996_20385 [Methylosinus sporium]BBU63956.1 hypothetical protein MSC49_38910 [Methylosinus sp. C49]
MGKTKCEGCGRQTPSFEIVEYGSMENGYKQLCRRCFNSEAAAAAGLKDFEHVEFDPIRLKDSGGKVHEFHFRTFLFGTGVALDAFELRKGAPAGYQFQVIAGPEEDLLAMLGRLIAKIQRALAVKHLEDGEHGLQIAKAGVVRALIDWDPATEGALPLLIIDGREISWEDLGRCLMSFEGFQFKLEVHDKSDEV